MKGIVTSITLFVALGAAAQQPGPVVVPNTDMHQIFLDEPAQKIEKLEYRDTGEPIEHQLSPDGKSIHLKEYDGKSPVAVTFINSAGQLESFVKARCHIHSYVPEI